MLNRLDVTHVAFLVITVRFLQNVRTINLRYQIDDETLTENMQDQREFQN